jgi:hypothetical protein
MKRPFKVIKQKVIKQDDRQRMQISFEGKADIYLIKTNEGFIIDVYKGASEDSLMDTVTIWEDDLDPSDEEIDAFKKKWGQTHKEICTELDVPEDGSDDYLMDDYFWIPNDEIWCNKHASLFDDNEQKIADFLQEVLSQLD